VLRLLWLQGKRLHKDERSRTASSPRENVNLLALRRVAPTIAAPLLLLQWNNLFLDNAGSAIASLNLGSVWS